MYRRQAVLSVLASVHAFAGMPAESADVTADQAAAIAVDAYIYFYPLVIMDVTRREMTGADVPGHTPVNTFKHARSFPPALVHNITRPNFDNLYSTAWLDLTTEPMIVTVPETQGRYYLLPMYDMWTDVIASPGQRTSGTHAGGFAIVPECWSGELPAGVERIKAPTSSIWIIGRIQADGPADFPAAYRVQDGLEITPLSQWGKGRVSGAAQATPTGVAPISPVDVVSAMGGVEYFTYAAALFAVHPPHATDWSVVERMSRLGIRRGESIASALGDPVTLQAIRAAPEAARREMVQKLSAFGAVVNGWQMNTDGVGVYGDDYLRRAMVAMTGPGANQTDDVIYPVNVADSAGRPVDGSQRYVLHFKQSELPPVNAFWSLTMYDANGFAAPNAINRFVIGSRDRLRYNLDGSLDLLIQRTSPGAGRLANWLPSPLGPLSMTLRLYSPKPEALDGAWAPPAVQRID